MSEPALEPGTFFCPHCGTKNPPYDFILNQGGGPQMRVQFVTVVCGGRSCRMQLKPESVNEWAPCRKILSVCLLACEINRVPLVGG